MPLLAVTDQTFEKEVLAAQGPVLVDFYADWCGPCKQLKPVLEQIAVELAGRLKVVQVDTEQNPYVTQAMQIQALPTMMLIQDKKLLDRMSGFMDKRALLERLKPHVPAGPAGVEKMDPQRAKLAVEAGLITPVDIRVPGDFSRTHLPGAINLPPDDHADPAASLPPQVTKVLLYGRTEDGVEPIAKALATAGKRTAILEGGLLAWEIAMLPVERGALRRIDD